MSSHQERLAILLKRELHREGFTLVELSELAAAILDSDVIREIRAEAWDEGHAAGQRNEHVYLRGYRPDHVTTNPYPRGVEK